MARSLVKTGAANAQVLPELVSATPRGVAAVLLADAASAVAGSVVVPVIEALQQPGRDARSAQLAQHALQVQAYQAYAATFAAVWESERRHQRAVSAQNIASVHKIAALQALPSVATALTQAQTPAQVDAAIALMQLLSNSIAASDRQLELAAT